MCYLVGDLYLGTLVDPLIHAQETEPVPLVRRQIGDRKFAGSILEIRHGDSRCGLFLGLDEEVRALVAKLAQLPRFPELPPTEMELAGRAATEHIMSTMTDW